jgi:glycosyltransferase involved in cell wall biosynthesis
MFEGKRIGVVVPAYNEETLICRVIETMPQFVDRVYVVDDCSKDGTCECVAPFLLQDATRNRVDLVRHAINQGVGAAIVTGYKKALEEGIDVVAVMAGDAQMDPTELERVVSPIVRGETDYVKGNRLFTGEAWHLIPKYRYLGNAFLSLLTKVASGYWHVADSQTGYTAISAKTLRLLPLDSLYPRYGYPNHLLVLLNIFDQRVKDVPVSPVYNIGERSGIRLRKVIPRLSWLLLKCFWKRMLEKYVIRDFHPLVFFYALGFALFPLGVASGVYLFAYRLFEGRVAPTSALFSVFLFVTGLQSLFFGMWFDMECNKDLKIK